MTMCADAARFLIYDPTDPDDLTDPDGGFPACANHVTQAMTAIAATAPSPYLTVRVLDPMTRTRGGSLTSESRRRRIPCARRQAETSMARRFGNRPRRSQADQDACEPGDEE